MSKIRFRGFTLIELLVVIAIIGILSAVILASLNTARQKGSDASIQSNLDTIRTQAELYYGDHGNTYNTTASAAGCTTAGSLFTDPTVAQALAQVTKEAGSVTCDTPASSVTAGFVVYAPLVAQKGSDYCIDSTGAGTTTSVTLSSTKMCDGVTPVPN